MIEDDYVSFEVAKLLQKKGFAEKCHRGYTPYGELDCFLGENGYGDIAANYILAPTHQMALKWIREKYDLHIIVYPWQANNEQSAKHWCCKVYETFNLLGREKYTDETPSSYWEGVESALKYSLRSILNTNKDIDEDYVSLNIAKLLEGKGFNEPCRTIYNEDGEMVLVDDFHKNSGSDVRMFDDDDECYNFVTAPTYQMAIKWIRLKLGMFIVIDLDVYSGQYFFTIYNHLNDVNPNKWYSGELCKTYGEAAENALFYALTK